MPIFTILCSRILEYMADNAQTTPLVGLSSSVSLRWGIFCLLSVGFYLGNQQILQVERFTSWQGVMLGAMGELLVSIVLLFVGLGRLYRYYGYVPSLVDTPLYRTSIVGGRMTSRPAKGIIQSCIAGVLNLWGFLALFGCLKLDNNLGSGYLSCIVVFAPIFLSILSYWRYSEKYSLAQVLGICTIFIGTQIYNLHWKFEGTVISLVGGAASLIIFTLRGLLNKSAASADFEPFTGSLLGCICECATGLIGLVVVMATGSISDFTWADLALCLAAGGCMGLGSFFLTYAIMIGNAGVSFSIATIQVLIMADLNLGGFEAIPIGIVIPSILLCGIGLVIAIWGGLMCPMCMCDVGARLGKRESLEEPFLRVKSTSAL